MTAYKDFQGKTLDDAIRQACEYYGVERERLEIEILNDAKTGIFGLVGTKKANIRAAKMRSPSDIAAMPSDAQSPPAQDPGDDGAAPKSSGKNARNAPREERAPEKKSKPKKSAAPSTDSGEKKRPAGKAPQKSPKNKADADEKSPLPPAGGIELAAVEAAASNLSSQDQNQADDLPVIDPATYDQPELLQAVSETVERLVTSIIGEARCETSVSGKKVYVNIDCGEDAGILLGREGQTLASIQYIAGRIIAKKLGGTVRLQFDVANYREQQDQRLRDLAVNLAEKARASKRSQSTRPLSAYQRRIIHLTLAAEEDIYTHSKGEGAQRRVVVQIKRQPKTSAE